MFSVAKEVMKQETILIRARLKTPRSAAIAFLWFIGVLRDRLGELEDRNLRNYEPLRGQDGGSVHDITSTLAIRTGFTPRWTAFLGFTFALLMLLSGRYIDWIILVFPLWVLLISIYILIDNLRRPSQTATTSPAQTNS